MRSKRIILRLILLRRVVLVTQDNLVIAVYEPYTGQQFTNSGNRRPFARNMIYFYQFPVLIKCFQCLEEK